MVVLLLAAKTKDPDVTSGQCHGPSGVLKEQQKGLGKKTPIKSIFLIRVSFFAKRQFKHDSRIDVIKV